MSSRTYLIYNIVREDTKNVLKDLRTILRTLYFFLMSSRTNVHLLTIYLADAQWSLNGIATGAGKSVVISQTAHYIA
jgi:hypothetical protein